MSGSNASPETRTNHEIPASAIWLHTAVIYTAVIAASWFLVDLSFHTPGLENMRLGLNFALILAAAIFWRWGPVVTSLGATLLAYQHFRAPLGHGRAAVAATLMPVILLLLVSAEVVLLMWRSNLAQRKLQEAMIGLNENSQALMQAQQASSAAAWTFDTPTGLLRWYDGGAPVFGRPNPETQTLPALLESIMEEDREGVVRAVEYTRRTGKPLSAEYRVVWPNGDVHWLEARGTVSAVNRNQWRGVTLDVTERKRAENALVQTEKLAVAGRLAAAIAHEINNPLEAITNLCYLARSTADEVTDGYIAMAEDELRRVAHITSQTLRFHRQQSAAAESDLHEIVQSILALYESRLRRLDVLVAVDCQQLPGLVCFAGEIRQVLANLIGNALDAMQGGGTLRIRLRASRSWRTRASAARITIGDNGHGIPALTLAHIYEPFFTTRTDMGTGLGLWVSTTLVEKHGGRLWVRSSTEPKRHGTVFSIVLPYDSPVAREVRPVVEPVAAS